MPIDLYYLPGSSPCRAVRLVAATIGIDLNLKLTDLMSGEHLKPEFIKMNPQHTLPTMTDNGFHLWESRAIMSYFVEKYAKNDTLYPKDPKQRAIVNQRLYFDMGSLYSAFSDYYYPIIFAGAPADAAKYEKLGEAVGYLDTFLDGQTYAAGNHLTIADLALIATVSSIELVKYDLSPFKNVTKWVSRMKKEVVKYDEINEAGLKAFQELIEKLKKK